MKNNRRARAGGAQADMFYAMPAYYYCDYETIGFRRAIDGVFIMGIVFLAALGGIIGLVWLTLAVSRQFARARMHAHRARKAGGGYGGMAGERMAINGDIAPATLKEYWLKSFRSPMDTLRVGSLLLDIECKVKVRLVFKNGRLVGRSGGMKGWLRENAKYVPYQTSMRYKRLAKLYRTALNLAPELPVEWFLPDCALTAKEINRRIGQFAAKLRADKRWDRDEVEARIAGIGSFTDESLAALRERGKEFFTRKQDSDTAGVEGVTRRLYRAVGIYRRPVGPLVRRNAVRTRRPPVFIPSEFRDRAYRDSLEGRINFSVRCAIRRDERHRMFRDHLTNKLHRELAPEMPDRVFATHFAHMRALSPLAVDPICNPVTMTS